MYKEEITHYSENLNRDMHIMIYGQHRTLSATTMKSSE